MTDGMNSRTQLCHDLKKIMEDYAPSRDVFSEDTPRVKRLKSLVSRLDEADRNIILAYAEVASYRELGRMLGVSYGTARNVVNRIKASIMNVWEW